MGPDSAEPPRDRAARALGPAGGGRGAAARGVGRAQRKVWMTTVRPTLGVNVPPLAPT
jgi:hypothetical protein